MRWIAGERPHAAGVGNEGAVATGFDTESTIIAPGGFSARSYGLNLDTAGETATLTPYSAIAGDISLNASKVGMTFWLHCTDWTPADWVAFVGLVPAAGAVAYSQLALQTSGKMAVVKGSDGSVGAETGAIFTDNAAAYFMYTVEWNGTTSWRHRVWVWGGTTPSGDAFSSAGWGSALIDFTETDAAITAGIHRNLWRMTASPKGVAPNTHPYMDDMCLWEFASDADLPTAPDTVCDLAPNATGTDSAFTTTQAGLLTGPNPANVDETDYNGDTDYDQNANTTSSVEENQTYNLDSIPTLPAGATISGTSWYSTAKSTSASAAVCRMRGYIGGTLENPALNWSVSTANYATAHHCLTLSPATGVAITEAEANGMECGIRKSALTRTVRLTHTFANVAIMPSLKALPYQRRASMRALLRR